MVAVMKKKMMYRIRSRAISALGSLVSTDGAVFYTASDVAYHIIRRSGADPDCLSVEDFNEVSQAVCAALSSSAKKKMDHVIRTEARIAPKLHKKGKAAYGYRIGMALGSQLVTEDTLRESKETVEAYESLCRNKMVTAERIIGMLSYEELRQVEAMIRARRDSLVDDLNRQIVNLSIDNAMKQD